MLSQNSTQVANQPQLAQTVFSILDSRIQFLENRIKHQFSDKPQQHKQTTCFVDHYEKLMQQYARINKALKQLQILKAWVKEENASLILSLLNNESYMSYQGNQLEKMIQAKEFHF